MTADPSGRHAIPPRTSTFIGRTRELVGLGADLTRHRLITLTGPGGVGKSRLAAEVADHAMALHRGEVWWVELKPLPAGAEITPAVLDALALPDVPGRSGLEQLAGFLGTRGALVVLDNAEHVLVHCRRTVTELLGMSATAIVLVTSREPLGVPGEQVRELDPLEVPDRTANPEAALRSPAARLFLDRAREAQPDLVVDTAGARDVAEICHRLDGLPLALELVAAGARGRTLTELRSALAEATPGLAAAASRELSHPALAGCIRWSYDLLPEAEQGLLRRLSVFAGSFSPEAVATVCGEGPAAGPWPAEAPSASLRAGAEAPSASLRAGAEAPSASLRAGAEALSVLAVKSLVRREPSGRYSLLETVRAFAAEELAAAGEDTRMHERHLAYALALAEQAERELVGANGVVVDRLAATLDDQRAALRHALRDQDAERALRLAAACGLILVHRGRYHDARGLVGAALARPGGSAAARVQAHFVAGIAAGNVGDRAGLDEAAAGCRRFAEQAGGPGPLGRAYLMEGFSRYHEAPDESTALFREALRHAEAADDAWALLTLPCDLAMQAARADDHATALAWVRRGTGRARMCGNDYMLAWLLVVDGYCHLRRGALARAREAAEEAGRRARSVGEAVSSAYADYVLAGTELAAGRPDHARLAAERGIATGERSQSLAGRDALRSQLAQARIALGAPDGLADLAAAVQDLDPDADPWEYCAAALALAAHRAAAGDPAGAAAPLASAARTGERLGSAWVAARAAALEGVLALGSGPGVAADRLHAALALALEYNFDLVAVDTVEALALDCALQARPAQTTRLQAAAEQQRGTLGFPRSVPARAIHARTTGLLTQAEHKVARAATRDEELTFRQVVSHLVRARGTRSRAAVGWASLTTAEREVADLAVEGLSNAAIAARLLVAPGTVKTHLGRIYAKLGVANRTELATAAARRARGPDADARA